MTAFLQVGEFDAGLVAGAVGLLCHLQGALLDPLPEPGTGHDFINQPPIYGALTLDAFLHGAKYVGEVPPHPPLVHDAGEPACTGQHRQQRNFRQGDRRITVVDQNNVIGCQGQLVATPGRRAIERRKIELPGVLAGVLHRIARFVSELAEIHLVGVSGRAQHANVGPCAKHADLARSQYHCPHFGVLETQTLHCIIELDIDTDIVGIQLELVVAEFRRVFVHVHLQLGDRGRPR